MQVAKHCALRQVCIQCTHAPIPSLLPCRMHARANAGNAPGYSDANLRVTAQVTHKLPLAIENDRAV
jgi:hypothetical protein